MNLFINPPPLSVSKTTFYISVYSPHTFFFSFYQKLEHKREYRLTVFLLSHLLKSFPSQILTFDTSIIGPYVIAPKPLNALIQKLITYYKGTLILDFIIYHIQTPKFTHPSPVILTTIFLYEMNGSKSN